MFFPISCNTKDDIVGHTRADGANWLNKAAALRNLRTHQCYPTRQESSLSALMLRLGLSLRFKHDTGDKRHFVRSINSPTDSMSWDEQQKSADEKAEGRRRGPEKTAGVSSVFVTCGSLADLGRSLRDTHALARSKC